ncbi:MAG: hypothetical protein R3E76_04330 [Planctomycetota bacterium]
MKTLIKIRNLLGMLALTAAIPAAVQAQSKPIIYGTPTLDRSAAGPQVPGTEPVISKIAELAANEEDWQTQALNSGLVVKDDKVLLEARIASGDIAHLHGLLELNGGKVEVVDSLAPDMRRIWVRVQDLEALQQMMPEDVGVELTVYRAPIANSYGLENSEGIGAMRTDIYEAGGLDGAGVTVAVLDIGFYGIESLEAGLTDGVGINDASDHGTAMVEVVRDIAPAAQILTYRLDENLDVYTATVSALESGADVIVCSLSWFELPAQGLASDAARLAQTRGAIWVNAAGNFADGAYYEAEGLLSVDIPDGTFLMFDEASSDYMLWIYGWGSNENVTLHFDYEKYGEDGTQNSTLALEVFGWDQLSGTFSLVGAGNPDLEHQVVSFTTGLRGMEYFPMVRVLEEAQNGRFRMFSPDVQLYYTSVEGSMANPAAVAGVVSVGAVNVDDYNSDGGPEAYSSQGGGIFDLKLELCGPTDVTTGIYGLQGFSGTSAAAAHVAGLMSLQLQDPVLRKSPTQFLRFVDIGDEGADAESGRGLVKAYVDDFEPDNVLGNGIELVEVGHTLSPSSDIDWMQFELAEAMSVDIEISLPATIYLCGEDGDIIEAIKSMHFAALPAGVYQLGITHSENSLEVATDPSYEMRVNAYYGAPDAVADLTVNLTLDSDGERGTATYTWTEPAGLPNIGYVIEVSANESFDKMLAAEEVRGTSFSIDGIEMGMTLYARVTANNPFGSSQPSATVAVGLPAQDFSVLPSDDANDLSFTNGTADTEVLAAPAGVEETASDEAAGCVGTTTNDGIALMLLALLGAAVTLRLLRTKQCKEVSAE